MQSLIIFASGRGSNAEAIINFFKEKGNVKVSLIVTNKADAGVIEVAEKEHIPFLIVNNQTLGGVLFIDQLRSYNPSLIVLAGFLKKIPDTVLQEFSNKIINIHPSLLPKHGGKGMYGHHVHQSVLDNGDKESGITIHMVNEHYDEGAILTQARCAVTKEDTIDTLAKKVHQLEHFYFPRTIEFLLQQM
ncbi:MAG: phosphoribosylglycinamide formyltransferase [Flavipsychrobacter sp.]